MTEELDTNTDALKLIQALRNHPEKSRPASELNFQGVALAGQDLSGLNLTGGNFAGADLTEANLAGANLFQADFSGASLVKANLDRAELTAANLTEANLEDAQAERVGLGMANLKKARLFNARLVEATLTKTDLSEADLRRANLSRVRMREAILHRADCTGADIRGADLSESDFSGAIMNDADLRDAKLHQTTGYETAEWFGVDLRDVNFSGAYRLRRFVVDENYLKEFRESSQLNGLVYRIWSLTSDCGRSVTRWCLLVFGIVMLFSLIYGFCGIDYGEYDNWIGPFYFSIVTLTTLGYGDVVPATVAARMVSISEVVLGYVMLGGLLSIFTNKMARRGE